MVANELTIYNATNISFLATKNSALVAIIVISTLRINNGCLRTPYVRRRHHRHHHHFIKIFIIKFLNLCNPRIVKLIEVGCITYNKS